MKNRTTLTNDLRNISGKKEDRMNIFRNKREEKERDTRREEPIKTINVLRNEREEKERTKNCP